MADLIDRNSLNETPDYDAGLLNDFGGGNVEWWQDYLRAEIDRANEFWRDAIAALPAQGVRDNSFFELIVDGMAEADRAMRKFPQPNYVISKVAEEAGEVVKAAIHCAENRETAENVRGEMRQLIAMLYRLWVEGDQVHGLAALAPAEAGGVVAQTRILHEKPVRVCPICDIADCATHRDASAPVDALVKALHQDQYLEVAEMLIRNEASRDYTQQLVMGLRYLADMIAAIREGRG